MDILTFETCWAVNSEIIKKSDIKLVYLYSTIKMMHGPVNLRYCLSSVIYVVDAWKPGGYFVYHHVQRKKFHVLPTGSICVFCVDVGTNMISPCRPYWLVFITATLCVLRSTNRILGRIQVRFLSSSHFIHGADWSQAMRCRVLCLPVCCPNV